ncbi:MAG: alpha/beta hydrolase [Chryseobacterium sp.]|nr:MAG: alpha/beta hydrolase [Chryseobacterium sp.]
MLSGLNISKVQDNCLRAVWIFLFALSPAVSFAQKKEIPLDTSYTINATFKKLIKKHPDIEIANPTFPVHINKKENIVYHKIGDRQLHADVFYPKEQSAQAYPAVIMVHGGGWRSGNKSLNATMAAQIAAKGYVVVAVEYRLSLEAKYPAAVYDIKAAVRWLRENAGNYHADKNKVAVMGFSAGAQLATLVGTTNNVTRFEGPKKKSKTSSAVQAIVNVDGTLAFRHPESVEGTVAAFWLGGTYDEVPEIWQEAAPLSHAGENTPPILFINSDVPRFHAGRDDMINKIKPFHIYSEVHTLANSPHSFWLFHPWFKPTVDYAVTFLDNVFGRK